MFLLRLRETLFFFWKHQTDLLWRLAPVLLPILVLVNYRFVVLHNGDPGKAMADVLTLLPQLFCGVAATAFTVTYSLRLLHARMPTLITLWREAARGLPALLVVQLLVGVAVFAGLLLLIVPGIYLMGALLPAYVIALHEAQSPLASLKASWMRFRAQAWAISACLCLLLLGLLLVLSGLEALGKLLDDTPVVARVLALSGLDLLGLLFSQMVAVLLVRFYELEDKTAKPVLTV